MPRRKRSVAADPPATVKSSADLIPPIPQNIESLVDPAMKRRAGILWRDCWMLRAAVDGQLNWYRRLRDTGTADGGIYRLEETKALCLGTLRPFIESFRPGLLDEPGLAFPMPDALEGWQAATLREYHDRDCTLTLQGLYGVAGNIAKALNHNAEPLLLAVPTSCYAEAAGQSGTPVERQAETLAGGDEVGDGQLQLKPCEGKAWSQFREAAGKNSELTTDRQVYDWYADEIADDAGELPSFANWSRYVRAVRKAMNQGKNGPRIGNETRSVVSVKRIEQPRKRIEADR